MNYLKGVIVIVAAIVYGSYAAYTNPLGGRLLVVIAFIVAIALMVGASLGAGITQFRLVPPAVQLIGWALVTAAVLIATNWMQLGRPDFMDLFLLILATVLMWGGPLMAAVWVRRRTSKLMAHRRA